MGIRHELSFCACTTACLASELPVSMGPRLHLWILIAKLRILGQNYKSLWVPDLTCRFVHAKHHQWQQNYKSLWVPALICGFYMQNCDFWTRIKSLYGYHTSPVVLCPKTARLAPQLLVSSLYGFQSSSVLFGYTTVTFGPE